MPKVSVVIPTYNRSRFLKAAVSSVLKQTYQDFEIIIIDDASTDNTQDVVTTFEEKKIIYIRHDQNKGEAGARNTGILNASGKYIAFLDDDDEWLPEKLAMQVTAFENSPSGTGLVYTGHQLSHYIKGRLIREWPKVPAYKGNALDILMTKNFIGPPSVVLMKRECMEKTGLFDPGIAYGLDYDYWIRVSKHFYFDCIAEPLVKYRIHENSLSSNIELRARGAQDLANKYGSAIIASDYWRSIYLPLGICLCNKGDMREGIKAFFRSIQYYPTSIVPYFYFGISLLGSRNFKKAIKIKETLRPNIKSNKV